MVIRIQATPFSATWIVAAFLITVVVISGYYAIASRQVQELRARRSESETQLKLIRDQLVGAGKAAQKTRSKALEEQVARAETLFRGRQEVIGRLKGGEIGNRDGYSKFLLALARQHVEGVWLTGIEIAGPRDDFAFQGRALRADLLSDYIKTLRKEEAFRGKPIGTLSLHELEMEPGGEQKSAAGPAPAPDRQGARPAVRVVEFKIGTGLATVAETAGK